MFGEYIKRGWYLCPIAPGSKGPRTRGWNQLENAIDDPDVADALPGAGLLHAYSGTCAIDIDDVPKATAWLAERGVQLDELMLAPDAVMISSGNEGHAKLIYRLDEPLTSKQITENKHAIIDFRCSTSGGRSVQDALPPTLHPSSGRRYEWVLGDAGIPGPLRDLPRIPDALRVVWSALLLDQPRDVRGQPTPVRPISARLPLLERVLAACDPDCDRTEWVKTLAKLHHETGGSEAGLSLADAWSSTGSKYTGREDVETRWRSFSLNRSNPATFGGLLPASADEFDDLPAAPVVADDAADAGKPDPLVGSGQPVSEVVDKKAALRALEERLIYVRTQDRYFDRDVRDLLAGDHALAHRYTPLMPKRSGRPIDPVKLLRESPRKAMVDALGFHPGESAVFDVDGSSYANTYRPQTIEWLEPTKRERITIEWLFSRIKDEKFRKWLMQMMAYVVQRPGVKIQSVPLIWSETQGNGKSTILKEVPELLVGSQYSREVNYTLLKTDFSDYLMNAWHINLTEFRAGTRAERAGIGEKLKPWITDRTIAIHPKGMAAFTMPNRLWITATSNEADAAPISYGDRRWGITELDAEQMLPADANELYEGLLRTDRARGVLRHYFGNLPTTGFSPTAPALDTAAKREMIEANLPQDIELLRRALESRAEPFSRDVVLADAVQQFLHDRLHYRPSLHHVGRILRKVPFEGQMRQLWAGNATVRVWVIRNHTKWLATPGELTLAYANGEVLDSPP